MEVKYFLQVVFLSALCGIGFSLTYAVQSEHWVSIPPQEVLVERLRSRGLSDDFIEKSQLSQISEGQWNSCRVAIVIQLAVAQYTWSLPKHKSHAFMRYSMPKVIKAFFAGELEVLQQLVDWGVYKPSVIAWRPTKQQRRQRMYFKHMNRMKTPRGSRG